MKIINFRWPAVSDMENTNKLSSIGYDRTDTAMGYIYNR